MKRYREGVNTQRYLQPIAAGLLGMALTLAAPAIAAPALTPEGAALVKKPIAIVPATSTEKVEGVEGIDGLRATFFVGCSPAVTSAMLWDIGRFQEIFPDIERLKVLKRSKSQIDAEFGIDVKVAWVEYSLRRRYDQKKRRIWWKEIGGDLNHVRGEWQIWPTKDPNVSKVRYSSFVEVSSLVPTSMIRDGALSAVEKLPEKVRRGCKIIPKSRKAKEEKAANTK